ncbi:hypothetical protein SSYM_1552 [Serratia symbiotica str. Tucson]|uniref:Uncharacterized protein n=1 Tax=Serratia symbiotica str. Tucson TaxID=914128 RepID=E9CMK1_9GAMM|nr:hypothetical protein SSYM_1552 [Serratia symbiotica str. Tucson]
MIRLANKTIFNASLIFTRQNNLTIVTRFSLVFINDIAIATGEIKLVEFLPRSWYDFIRLFAVENRNKALKRRFSRSICSTNIGMLIQLNFNNTRQVSMYKNDTKQL